MLKVLASKSDPAFGFVDLFSGGAIDRLVSVAPFSSLYTNVDHARRRPKRLAEKLRQIRAALGLSQREMAEWLTVEVSDNLISKYEKDKSMPPIELVLAYARVANVPMEQIVDDDLDLTL